jgi:hypothetical protein
VICSLARSLKKLELWSDSSNRGDWLALTLLTNLEELVTIQPTQELRASFYSVLQGLPRLRSLCLYKQSVDYTALAAVSQLREFKHCSADIGQELLQLSALTAITSLAVHHSSNAGFSDVAQAALSAALTNLSQLRRLELSSIPVGPVTDALARLPGLTSLTCRGIMPATPGLDHRTWSLPYVQELHASSMTWQQLASLHAPQLKRLRECLGLGLSINPLKKDQRQSKPGPEVLLAAARGPLRWCNRVSLHWPGLSAQEAAEWLGSLAEGWEPDASVMQPCEDDCEASLLKRLGISRQLTGSSARVWELELSGRQFCLTGALLSLLPVGLTCLSFRQASMWGNSHSDHSEGCSALLLSQ